MDIKVKDILSILPHRYPFLFVDKVTEYKKYKAIYGIKNVSLNESQFLGHFPLNPVMPGVLIIESLVQLSALLISKSISLKINEILFTGIENFKFRGIVSPGDQMLIQSHVLQNINKFWKFNVKALVEEQIVSEGVVTAMIEF